MTLGKKLLDIKLTIYLETVVESMEELNDEIDSWITWRKFEIEGKLLGLSDADISAEWGETIRSNRANCLFRRGGVVGACLRWRRTARQTADGE